MLHSKDEIERILKALGERLNAANAPVTELAVCGGAALYIAGLMTRTVTKDVDAFAIVQRDSNGVLLLTKSDPLPDYLNRQVLVIARDFNLPEDWLNGGPTSVLDFGLPDGLVSRLRSKAYGPRLVIHFLHRVDQIYFKLYAAADQGPDSRHIEDLKALRPTETEIEAAARWTMTHDDSEGFKVILRGCLRHLGYENAAQRI